MKRLGGDAGLPMRVVPRIIDYPSRNAESAFRDFLRCSESPGCRDFPKGEELRKQMEETDDEKHVQRCDLERNQ
jgi:hypothetical protein